jgi:hypothetical protein
MFDPNPIWVRGGGDHFEAPPRNGEFQSESEWIQEDLQRGSEQGALARRHKHDFERS